MVTKNVFISPDSLESFKGVPNEEENEKQPKQSEVQNLVLFFSFDISNSARYKEMNPTYWPIVITQLFKRIQDKVEAKFGSASELWRILGDEIVFVKKILNLEDLWESVKKIWQIETKIVNELKDGSFFKVLKDPNMEKIMHLNNIISLKSAAWVALVSDQTNENEYTSYPFGNIEISFNSKNANYRILEFLGNDVDAGFRLSKAVISGNLVISFELASLLFEYIKIMSQKNKKEMLKIIQPMHIITYREFKGIWDNNLYPVIWYYNGSASELKEEFHYDEYAKNDLIREYIENQKFLAEGQEVRGLSAKMYEINEKFFAKIKEDRNLNEKLSKMKEILEKNSSMDKVLNHTMLELHCAVICYRKIKNEVEVFIAKRSETRPYNPNKWEFGCAKAVTDMKLKERIEKEYKNDFGLEIELEYDQNREGKQPVPLAVFELPKDNLYHQGLILIAKVKKETPLKFDKKKFSECIWIKKSDIEKYSKEPSVDDFKNSLEKAFKHIEGEKSSGIESKPKSEAKGKLK